jgi:hypothetical protein
MKFTSQLFAPSEVLPGEEVKERAVKELLNLFITAIEKGEVSQVTDIRSVFSSGNRGTDYTRVYYIVIEGKINSVSVVTEETKSEDDYPYLREEKHYITVPNAISEHFKTYAENFVGWKFLENSTVA